MRGGWRVCIIIDVNLFRVNIHFLFRGFHAPLDV